MDGLTDVSADMLGLAFKFLSDIGGTAANIMSGSGNSAFGQISVQLSKLVQNYMMLFQSLGYAISIMFFMFALLNLITSEQLTLEQFIKKFCWLFVGIALVGLSPMFFEKITAFGDAFTTMIVQNRFELTGGSSDTALHDTLATALKTVIKDNPDYNEIQKLVFSLVMCLISVAIGLSLALVALVMLGIVYVIGFSWIIEKNVRGLFLPIGLSMFSDEGWRGAGGRYFRKFLAVCCNGAVIAFIGKITNGCIAIAYKVAFTNGLSDGNSFLGDFLPALLKSEVVVLGVAAAAIAAMFKSQQIVNDTFGA